MSEYIYSGQWAYLSGIGVYGSPLFGIAEISLISLAALHLFWWVDCMDQVD